jgi:two-component system sensor histidine kinase DesK
MKLDPTAPRSRKIDRIDYLWLAYLVFYFIEPFFRRSLLFWIESVGLAAAMVALYIGFLRLRQHKLRILCIVGIFFLGVASYPTNSGAIAFFIYTGALLPFLFSSVARVFLLLIADAALLLAEGWWLHHPLNSLFGIFFILVVGGSNIFFAQKQRADCKLSMAHEEIEALAAVAERERIARDLHDVLGHTLSVIVLKAELAGRLLAQHADVTRATQEIGDVERTARAALTEVRETIGGYRARGFAAEIDAARNALAAAGVKLELESVPAPGTLRPAEETVLALAVREAATNVVRHSQAKTCKLRFLAENGHRTLVIEDDGLHASAHEGNGLRGMRERVESLGGTLQLQREHGTRLMIELPAPAGSAS